MDTLNHTSKNIIKIEFNVLKFVNKQVHLNFFLLSTFLNKVIFFLQNCVFRIRSKRSFDNSVIPYKQTPNTNAFENVGLFVQICLLHEQSLRSHLCLVINWLAQGDEVISHKEFREGNFSLPVNVANYGMLTETIVLKQD